MARAHFVKRARKDYPEHGIKKGESYYWWAFMVGGRGGAKRYSKTEPKPSQLTQSEFWSAVYGIQEGATQCPDWDEVESVVESLKAELENLRGETQDKYDNLPDSLQSGSSGELLQGRVDAVEESISNLEAVDISFADIEREEGENNEDYEERAEQEKQGRAEEIWGEVTDALQVSCE